MGDGGQLVGNESLIGGDWVLTGQLDENGYVSTTKPEFQDYKLALSWTLNYSEIDMIKLNPDLAFPDGDGSIISSVVISPVMMYIHFTGDNVAYKIKPAINFKGGAKIIVDTMNRAWDAGDDVEGLASMYWAIDYGTDLRYIFMEMIDIEDVESVEINGPKTPIQ